MGCVMREVLHRICLERGSEQETTLPFKQLSQVPERGAVYCHARSCLWNLRASCKPEWPCPGRCSPGHADGQA